MTTAANRTFGDDTTFEDLQGWHREDQPLCMTNLWQMGPPGYRCLTCGWMCLTPEWRSE